MFLLSIKNHAEHKTLRDCHVWCVFVPRGAGSCMNNYVIKAAPCSFLKKKVHVQK